MPYESHKYKGADYLLRAASAASICMALTTLLTYPLDLIHTRMTCDMSKTQSQRLYTTTFDCFNRTNIDEGRKSLYKGFEVALIQAALRGVFTLPVYDFSLKYLNSGDSQTLTGQFASKLGPSLISSLLLSLVLYPFDTMKRCLQLNGGRGQSMLYRGFVDGFKKFYSAQGLRAFYRGAGVFFGKELLQGLVIFSIYESLNPKAFGIE